MRLYGDASPAERLAQSLSKADRVYFSVRRELDIVSGRILPRSKMPVVMRAICSRTNDKYVAMDVFGTFFKGYDLADFEREWARCWHNENPRYLGTRAKQAPNASHRERISSVLGGAADQGTPIANPGEVDFFEDNEFVRFGPLWLFHFGAYGEASVYVWADGIESAFEAAVEWLDDHAPGLLVTVGEEDYQRAAAELGKVWDPRDPDDVVIEAAEADMTMIGHTTLQHGNAVASWEWTYNEIERGSNEWDEVVERSRAE